MATVQTRQEGPVLEIVLNRPDKRNAIDGDTADLLTQAWDRLREDESLHVGLLAGNGDAFCAGADLANLDTLGPGLDPSQQARDAFLDGQDGYLGPTRRTDRDKPLIAAIEGPARAGGLELALLADLRIASSNASFGFTNREWNVPLVDGGTQRLPRIVGLGRALELILTGNIIDADEAQRIGLVNRVVPEGEALEAANELAHGIAALPQESLRADLESAYRGLGRPLADGLRIEASVGQEAIDRDGFLEDVEAFFGDSGHQNE